MLAMRGSYVIIRLIPDGRQSASIGLSLAIASLTLGRHVRGTLVTGIKSTFLPGLLAAVLVTGTSLQASMVIDSTPIPASDAGGQFSLPTTASFTLPEFNPALGTLTGVELSFSLMYQGEVTVLNFSEYFGPGTTEAFTNGSSTVPIDMSTPSGLLSPLVMAAYSGVSGSVPVATTNDYFGPSTAMTPTFNPVSGDFPLYTGVGDNSYTLSYGTGTYAGTGTYVGFGGDGNSSGTATVTYTYTPVPEPASVVLLGLGAAGLWWAARRRPKT